MLKSTIVQNKKRRLTYRGFKAVVFLTLFGVLLVFLEQQIRPMMRTMVEYQCRHLCGTAINQSVVDVLSRTPESFKNIYQLSTDQQGRITSIVADPLAVNDLKSVLTEEVSQRISSLGANSVSIPFGTLLGWQVAAGKGPQLQLRVIQESYVDSTVYSKLKNSGINQTELQVFIRFRVNMGVLLSGYSTNVEVEDEVCIAQALLVGDVPEFLTRSPSVEN